MKLSRLLALISVLTFCPVLAFAESIRVSLSFDVTSVIEAQPVDSLKAPRTIVGWNTARTEGLTATLTHHLDFGLGTGGMREKTIRPDETGAAQIRLIGKPGRAVQVTLPPGVEMASECQCGYIIAETFTADVPSTVFLDERGEARIRVGATREALPFNLKADRYRGTTQILFVTAD